MKYLVCLIFLLPSYIFGKVLIITHVHSRPDFIELHAKTFQAFLKDDYEYVVFNDASNTRMAKKMEETCQKLNVRCIRVPQHLHKKGDPGARHTDSIAYSLEKVAFDHDGIVLMIDSDMFLTRPFSAAEYCKDLDLLGCYQSRQDGSKRVVYVWPGLVFMNMQTMPNKRTINFLGEVVDGIRCDVGGHTYFYIQNNPTLRYRLYDPIGIGHLVKDVDQLRNLGYDDLAAEFIFSLGDQYNMEFHADNNFLHYYAGGSNWPGYKEDFLREKDRRLNYYIDRLLEYYSGH